MQRGDLIFFNTEGVVNNHVGIYLGDNKFLHDASTNGVWVNNLEGYWKNAFNGTVRRVVEQQIRSLAIKTTNKERLI